MHGKKIPTSKNSDRDRNGGADQTQCAFLAASGGSERVERYGSENFQGWEAFAGEEARLIDWAKQCGLFVSDITAFTKDALIMGGATEHDTFFFASPDANYVLRRTIRESYGHPHLRATPAQYLQRLVDYNSIFSDTLMEVVAVSCNSRGNGVIWTKQAYVEGRHFNSMKELSVALRNEGWEEIFCNGIRMYQHQQSAIVISDVTEGNIIKSLDGNLRFIDVIVESVGD